MHCSFRLTTKIEAQYLRVPRPKRLCMSDLSFGAKCYPELSAGRGAPYNRTIHISNSVYSAPLDAFRSHCEDHTQEVVPEGS